MKVTELEIPGVLLIEPKVFGDDRGFFLEQWQRERYAAQGISQPFIQCNLSRSSHGTLRGLHLQHPHAQAKLVSVPHGRVLDVAVDVRRGSPTYGKWVSAELSGDNHHQLFVPRGCAHGFCVISEWALFSYMCDEIYSPQTELSVRFDDPDLAIAWPQLEFRLSEKDEAAPLLKDIDERRLPVFGEV